MAGVKLSVGLMEKKSRCTTTTFGSLQIRTAATATCTCSHIASKMWRFPLTVKKITPLKPELFNDPGLRGAPCRLLQIGKRFPDQQIVTLIAAAIFRNGKVWTARRHSDIIHVVFIATGMNNMVMPSEQGFLTDTGHFVSRTQAVTIAEKSGQLPAGFDKNCVLLSEYLW